MHSGPHKLLAKSPRRRGDSPEALTDHLNATLHAARLLRVRVGNLAVLPADLRALYWETVTIAAFLHDAGKVASGFQSMVAGRTRTWGQRHEVVSLGFLPVLLAEPVLRSWVALGVVTHHRSLTSDPSRTGKPSLDPLYGSLTLSEFREELGEIDLMDVSELLAWLADTGKQAELPLAHPVGTIDVLAAAHTVLKDILSVWAKQAVRPADGLAGVLLQGAVTLADHLSSAHGDLLLTQPLNRDFPAHLHRVWADRSDKIRPHQQEAGQTDGHVIIRGPTGSGKTEAGLLWAPRQVEAIAAATSGVPRVFYTLPYLASINAMADRLSQLLDPPQDHPASVDSPDAATPRMSVIGVSHSKAGSYYLATAARSEDEQDGAQGARGTTASEKAVARAAATKLFRENVRVGTPYQLLRGALAGPTHSSVLVDMANSVFLLDELHAYDAKRLGFILAMVDFWAQLGGRVGVLSATLPDVLVNLLKEVLGEVRLIDGHGQGFPPRHRLRLRHHHLTDPASLAEMRQHLAEQRSVLVVANNVKDAQAIYQHLAPIARGLYGDDAAQLLHARFRRMDRTRIERRILARYRSMVNDRRPGLVVATQVIEVSLDVDFDVLHTSAATLEALLQRFGRVNRIAKRSAADLMVHLPAYARRQRGGPEQYADGIYPRDPVESAWQILTRHDGFVVDEESALTWLNEIYATPWGNAWQQEVIKERQRFTKSFLTFNRPFDDREHLSEDFDQLFEGTEAILTRDRDRYAAALASGSRAAGRLQAEEYLIPLPVWVPTKRDSRLGIQLVDADYDEHERGLTSLHAATDTFPAYAEGVML